MSARRGTIKAPRFDSLAVIAFTVHHEAERPTSAELRAGLLQRLIDLDAHDEWHEAIDLTDTMDAVDAVDPLAP